jgi:hypothetical protein
MKLLLDTRALLWFIGNDPPLSTAALPDSVTLPKRFAAGHSPRFRLILLSDGQACV